MKRTTARFALLLSTALRLAAQTQIQTTINANQAIPIARIAVPRPETTLPLETINAPFFAPLTRDLAYSGVFAIAPIPPNIAAGADLTKASGAQFVLSLKIAQEGQDYLVDARLLEPAPGDSIVDACAAPGTKTTHLAQLMGNRGRILALDPQPARLARVGEAAARLGVTIVESVEGPVEALAPRWAGAASISCCATSTCPIRTASRSCRGCSRARPRRPSS